MFFAILSFGFEAENLIKFEIDSAVSLQSKETSQFVRFVSLQFLTEVGYNTLQNYENYQSRSDRLYRLSNA